VHSHKTYPTTFANITSVKPTYGTISISTSTPPTGSTIPVANAAVQATLSAAGLVGAGLLAVLASF
jgi:hypothetical protein